MNPFSPWSSIPGCTSATYTDVATILGIKCLIYRLLAFLPPLILLVAVLFIIYAGFQMITGADDPKQVQTAQQTITYAIIGIVGLGISWMVLVLIENFTGAPVTNLNI